MKYHLLILCLILTTSCTNPRLDTPEDSVREPVEQWDVFEKRILAYRQLEPTRPIAVLFLADWDVESQLIRRYAADEAVFVLLNEHEAFPLVADCSHPGLWESELETITGARELPGLFVSLPDGSDSWVQLTGMSEDAFQVVLGNRLAGETE